MTVRLLANFDDLESELKALQSSRFASKCPDPRLKFIMENLVQSLHDFARKVDLTTEEWMCVEGSEMADWNCKDY